MEWNADFSLDYYRKILSVLASEFECTLLADVLKMEIEKPTLCVRHDIDFDPEKAIAMAKIEQEYGLISTYYVMINSPLYNVEMHRTTLQKLLDMGNEIGLHFYRKEVRSLEEISQEVEKDCEMLEDLLGITVRTISFHRPPQHILRTSTYINGRINAYCARLMEWYISDSRCRFRVGEPIQAIKEHRGKILQFLIHPLWWSNKKHASAEERITDWFKEKTKGFDRQQRAEFARKIYEVIGIRPVVLI